MAKTFPLKLFRSLNFINPSEQNGITCFRAYDKDIPEYAVAIDVYENYIHVQEYRSPESIPNEVAERRLTDILSVIPSVFNVPEANIFLKQRQRQRQLNQYEKHAEEQLYGTASIACMSNILNF